MYSPSIDALIKELKKLPSIGTHAAERFVFYWLKSGKKPVSELTLALKNLIDTVKSCEICFDFSDGSPCPICADPKRDQTTLCVVAEPWDRAAIENTSAYKGKYFVLRGTVDASDPASVAETKIPILFERLKNTVAVTELVLALNPDLSGDATMLYIENECKKNNPRLRITRLARGLPLGADLRYADDLTLSAALKNRIQK